MSQNCKMFISADRLQVESSESVAFQFYPLVTKTFEYWFTLDFLFIHALSYSFSMLSSCILAEEYLWISESASGVACLWAVNLLSPAAGGGGK